MRRDVTLADREDEDDESSGLHIFGLSRRREDARPVKVRVTFGFTDAEREQIAAHYGESGKAPRVLLRRWIEEAVATKRLGVPLNSAVP